LFWEEWVRNHRFFAAVFAAALMLGMASPALATTPGSHGKGKALAKGHAKQKPGKGPKAGVSGGGSVGTAQFSIQARAKKNSHGQHFNWTDGAFKLRCGGEFVTSNLVNGATVDSVDVTFKHCTASSQAQPFELAIHVTDAGQPSATAKDRVTFTLANVVSGGDLTGGNVKIRP
jgi:hypothetical protein